jgi:hypothetical protein
MTTPKPRIRFHTDGTVSRRVATHDGWVWMKVSGDGLNQLGGLTMIPEASPLEVSSQNLPALVDAGAGLLGIPDFFRRTDGLTVARLVERAALRASA